MKLPYKMLLCTISDGVCIGVLCNEVTLQDLLCTISDCFCIGVLREM